MGTTQNDIPKRFRQVTMAHKSCEFPVIPIEMNWNTSEVNCVLSKPITIDLFRYNALILCPTSENKTWNTAVVLKSTLRYYSIHHLPLLYTEIQNCLLN